MSDNEMLAWAERWHYPRLVIGERDVIRHGRQFWEAFIADASQARKDAACERINRWNERIQAA